MKRPNVLSYNIVLNIILQVVTIGCGLVLPQLIIRYYGSEVNGIVSSITQFLSYIVLLESGIGGVIRAVLYKPLAQKNTKELSAIVKATNQFFWKIGAVFFVYLLLLSLFFNEISNSGFEWIYTASLVIVLGISTLVQYFFGITYQTFLQADQKYWLTSGMQIITLILNLIFSVILIRCGCSIHVVKLMTAFIYTARPICFNLYVRRVYKLDRREKPNKHALKQRWDGFGHHIAYFIHSNTDIVILTIFSGVVEVSVYSVYMMVVNGIRALLGAVSSAIEPYFGNLIALCDQKVLKKKFTIYNILNFYITTIAFCATAFLIVPFVQIYTEGITDANYIRPGFSIILVLAEAMYCIRNPYACIIFAAGHFKQTKRGAYIEALINIVTSLLLVKHYGLSGVAFGTLIAMVFRTVEYVIYLSRNLVYTEILDFVKLMCCAWLSTILSVFVRNFLVYEVNSFLGWVCLATVLTTLIIIITTCVYGFFFRNQLINLLLYLKRKNYE